jgi:hypothetical protein
VSLYEDAIDEDAIYEVVIEVALIFAIVEIEVEVKVSVDVWFGVDVVRSTNVMIVRV